MKKSAKIIATVGIISIIISVLTYIAYMNYTDYYSYIISSKDDSDTAQALLSFGIKRNHELLSLGLYVKYNEDNMEDIGRDMLLDRADILEKIEKIKTDELWVDYHLNPIPYDRIIDYEAIRFDLTKIPLNEIGEIIEYLGLEDYIRDDRIILDINDIRDNPDFIYSWIIDKCTEND